MIAALRFDRPYAAAGGRLLRRPRFENCSSLPLSAMCMVANGVREQLSRLLGAEFECEVVEPAMPQGAAKSVLFAGALVYRVRGRIGDVFIVLRPADGMRLAGAAFGEPARGCAVALSGIERQTLDRIAASLGPQCAALCGSTGTVAREDPKRAQSDSATYFEVRTVAEPRIAIGFALDRDPEEAVGERIGVARLLDVPVELRAQCARGAIGVRNFVVLSPGATLALATPLGSGGSLHARGVPVARVSCGESAGRAAVQIEAGPAV